MSILARFRNFCDFHDFWKAVATAFLGISKIATVNFEINPFCFYLFKNFCFPVKQTCAQRSWNLRSKLKEFSAMLLTTLKFLNDAWTDRISCDFNTHLFAREKELLWQILCNAVQKMAEVSPFTFF